MSLATRLLFVAICFASAAFQPIIAAELPTPKKLRVLLTYGGHGFEEKPFFAMFDRLADIQVAKAAMPKAASLLKPGLEKEYDVIVRYDMAAKFSSDEEKAFVELLHRGIGLVALHHNLCAQSQWPEYTKILGGKYCFQVFEQGDKKFGPSHYEHDRDMQVTVADRDHPITRGLADFAIHDEVYNHYFVAQDAHVLLTTNHAKNDRTIAWTHEYAKSRVFYFQLGHDSQAWKNAAYPEVLLRGIRWAAGRD